MKIHFHLYKKKIKYTKTYLCVYTYVNIKISRKVLEKHMKNLGTCENGVLWGVEAALLQYSILFEFLTKMALII